MDRMLHFPDLGVKHFFWGGWGVTLFFLLFLKYILDCFRGGVIAGFLLFLILYGDLRKIWGGGCCPIMTFCFLKMCFKLFFAGGMGGEVDPFNIFFAFLVDIIIVKTQSVLFLFKIAKLKMSKWSETVSNWLSQKKRLQAQLSWA